jgi:uncharacterized protein YndB with AHSA1/START domain
MKLKFEVLIGADPSAVWKAFDDSDRLRSWQPTLVSFTHRSGEPGHPDAVSEFVYEENGRRITMTETITERRQPDFMAGMYESSQGTSLIVNTFETVDKQHTRWTAWHNMRFRGASRFIAIFLLRSVRRRVENDMQRFKLMVETDIANSAS